MPSICSLDSCWWISAAEAVFCCLFPDVMAALARRPCDELKPGTVSVSSKYPLPVSTSERILFPAGTIHDDPVYIYRMPASTAE